MRRRRVRKTILLTGLVFGTGALIGASETARPRIVFRSVGKLRPPGGASSSVVGGKPANAADWPATFYTMQGRSACTANLVGPRVLLTAAHCVVPNLKPTLVHNDVAHVATCTVSDQYNSNDAIGRTADWALCVLDKPVNGIIYETVNTDPGHPAVGDSVVLTGFGCTGTSMSGGNDGVLRTAETAVTKLPSGGGNDIVTTVPTGGPTICPGDSGGGAFVANGQSRRVQVSVNSRTLVSGGVVTGTSLLASLTTPGATRFFKGWMQTTGESICGLTGGMPRCRETP